MKHKLQNDAPPIFLLPVSCLESSVLKKNKKNLKGASSQFAYKNQSKLIKNFFFNSIYLIRIKHFF